jgi:hypothetical protein
MFAAAVKHKTPQNTWNGYWYYRKSVWRFTKKHYDTS